MQNGLYVALSSQLALQKRLETIADNVANANTVGFRATDVSFDDIVTGIGSKGVAFASPGQSYIPEKAGPLRETGNRLDFAIQGDAWFAIQTPAGTVLTRDGRFSLLATGELVTLEGHPVLDAGGAGIQLNPQGGVPEAGRDGTLRQNGQMLGAIGLYEYQPGQNARRFGNSGIVPDRQPQPVVDRPDIGVAQGFVEDFDVNPVLEMTRLIQVQRTFEYVSSLIRDSENAMDEARRALGPTS